MEFRRFHRAPPRYAKKPGGNPDGVLKNLPEKRSHKAPSLYDSMVPVYVQHEAKGSIVQGQLI